MSLLAPAEGKILADLNNPACLTIGRKRIEQVMGIVSRLLTTATAAIEQAQGVEQHSELLVQGWWLALSGELAEEMIAAQPRLSAEEKDDLLKVLQLRYDADAYRAIMGPQQNPLPAMESPIGDLVYSGPLPEMTASHV